MLNRNKGEGGGSGRPILGGTKKKGQTGGQSTGVGSSPTVG